MQWNRPNCDDYCDLGEWVIDNTEGQIIGQGPLNKGWRLKFDFKPTANSPDVRTFLHLTDGGPGDHPPGDPLRVIAFYLTPTANEVRMSYEFDGVTTNNHIHAFVDNSLVMNQWNTFLITQRLKNGKYYLSSTVNGYTYPDVENSNPRDYPNANVYSSMTNPAASGSLRGLEFCTVPPFPNASDTCSVPMYESVFPVQKPVMSNPINTRGVLLGWTAMRKNWRLSFAFKPTAPSSDWRSFLHLTRYAPGDFTGVLSLWMTPSTFGSDQNKPSMHYEFDGSIPDPANGAIPSFTYDPLNIDSWNTFVITQIMKNGQYILSTTINGQKYPDEVNADPRDYPSEWSVTVYTAVGAGGVAAGLMKNFQFCTSDNPSDIIPHPISGTSYQNHIK